MKLLIVVLAMLLAISGFAVADSPTPLRLATTTSTDNSGLLNVLLPFFEKDSGYRVHVIAVGTGKALRMGRDGDVDVVLVHALAAEEKFVRDGYGLARHAIMYNDFIIVGPGNDPAGISGSGVSESLRAIAAGKNIFISRGDNSGTHKRERSLWGVAATASAGRWYREAGQGMGKVLQMASELQAYTLTDRGTWLALRNKLDLKLLVEDDERLFNPYGMIAVNQKNYPDINQQGAAALIEWMISPRAQKLIAAFTMDGQQLFKPLRLPE